MCLCLYQFDVHCRIGSLENVSTAKSFRETVHCRIGSLESLIQCG